MTYIEELLGYVKFHLFESLHVFLVYQFVAIDPACLMQPQSDKVHGRLEAVTARKKYSLANQTERETGDGSALQNGIARTRKKEALEEEMSEKTQYLK